MELTYHVVFRGKLLRDFDLEQVALSVAALFKTDVERAKAKLADTKWVIKSGLNKDLAQRIQDQLRSIGMMVNVVQDDVPANTAPTPQSAPAPAPAPATAAATTTLTTTANDTPLQIRAAVPAFSADLSAYTLAEVGVQLVPAIPVKAVSIDTSSLSLAEVGAVIGEKKPMPKRWFDTSQLSVAAIETGPEKLPSLWKELV